MKPVIVWFRRDLRLADNAALLAACASGAPVLPLFMLEEDGRPLGSASRWWLHHGLAALDRAVGGRLVLRRGTAAAILPQLAREVGASAVMWNRCYEPEAVTRDAAIEDALGRMGVAVTAHGGALLHEPGELKTAAGKPFRVFTPFWKALRRLGIGRPQPAPRDLRLLTARSDRLGDWQLLPRPDWAEGFEWTPGENAAQEALYAFLPELDRYRGARDLPDRDGTSRLSPHLHWGEISPRQVWHAVQSQEQSDGAETFLKELGWRDFCAQLLFHNPTLPEAPLDTRFAKFPWRDSEPDFHAWTRGQTGIPIVDAGMRQLWQTGWMHNRVRMIAASFLVKHLGLHWRRGEEWFWNCLVDADLASNAANWQWVAGSGADAAPFFRIFNPVLQGEKFDPDGLYVRRFVPQLAGMPQAYIHKPWAAPRPPPDYPAPIVDLAAGRARALDAFHALKR